MKPLITLLSATLVSLTGFANWTQKANLPAASRIGPASFVIGNTAYIAGGRDAGMTYLNDCWAYDAQNDTWTQKAGIPNSGVLLPGGFAINNFGYLCCGWNAGGQTSNLYKYDPSSNSWTSGTVFPGGSRYAPTNFVINDKVYVGLGYSPLYNDLWEFDPSNNSWTQKASMPSGPRQAFVNFALNGNGYVGTGLNQAGMNNGYTGMNDFHKYNPASNTWSPAANIPGYPRHSASSFVIGNYAFVTVGLNFNLSSASYTNETYMYDPVNDTWTPSISFPVTGRQAAASFAVGSCGYIMGGLTQASSGNTYYNELWQFCSTVGTDETEPTAEFNLVYDHSNNQLMLSGKNAASTETTVQLYDINGKEVLSHSFVPLKNYTEQIPLEKMTMGFYLYSIKDSKHVLKSGKIMIQ